MIKSYDKYKPSGIEWLGDVPDHWSILRVKELSQRVKTGTTPSSAKGDFFSEGTENWFTPSDMNDNEISNSSRKVIVDAFKNKELEYFPPHSIYLIGIGGTLGRIAISNVKASCNQQINVIIFNHKIIISRFAFYQMLVIGSTLIKWSNYTTMPIFTQTNTKSLSLALPLSLVEQNAISNYLDTKTQAIDKKVNLLTKKADYYKELRKGIINEAVCKGLDKNVKLKESGIDWIGKIPKHWETLRIKDYTYLKARIGWQGLRSDEFLENTNWYCVTGTDFSNGSIDWANCYCVAKDRFDQDKKIQLMPNDLLITKDGTIGKIAFVKELPKQSTLNSGVFVTRPLKGKYSNNFMFWLLTSDVFTRFIDYNKNGTTILHLYQNIFEKFFYCLPPKTEQTAIANYLDEKTQKIDAIVSNIGKQIETLKELRKTLINDVVTGKIKVIN